MTTVEGRTDSVAHAESVDWARVQAASGLIFATFLAVHLATTFSAIFSPDAFTAVQRTMRIGYQFVVLEIGIAAAVLVHIVAGIKRWRRLGPQAGRARRLHRWTAVFLALVIFEHVTGTRGLNLYSGADTGFGAVSFTLHWFPEWFAPYYLVLGSAGIFHALYGGLTALSRFGWHPAIRLRGSAALWWTSAIGVGAIGLALAAFAGLLYAVPDAFDNDYARFYLDTLGEG